MATLKTLPWKDNFIPLYENCALRQEKLLPPKHRLSEMGVLAQECGLPERELGSEYKPLYLHIISYSISWGTIDRHRKNILIPIKFNNTIKVKFPIHKISTEIIRWILSNRNSIADFYLIYTSLSSL